MLELSELIWSERQSGCGKGIRRHGTTSSLAAPGGIFDTELALEVGSTHLRTRSAFGNHLVTRPVSGQTLVGTLRVVKDRSQGGAAR